MPPPGPITPWTNCAWPGSGSSPPNGYFLVRAGFSRKDDTLSDRILKTPLPDGPGKGMVCHLEEMLEEYYRYREWDANGRPTPEKLRDAGTAGRHLTAALPKRKTPDRTGAPFSLHRPAGADPRHTGSWWRPCASTAPKTGTRRMGTSWHMTQVSAAAPACSSPRPGRWSRRWCISDRCPGLY